MRNDERIKIDLMGGMPNESTSINLPLHVLVLMKLGNNDLKVHKVSKKTMSAVMKSISPSIEYTVRGVLPGHDSIEVDLTFHEAKHFRPEHLIMAIPELKHLVGMRNLLKSTRDKAHTDPKYFSELYRKCN